MNYDLIKDILTLLESFESSNKDENYKVSIDGFCQWIIDNKSPIDSSEIHWEGKANGRSIESVISTLLVHMGKYAKSYSKSAIYNSDFSTQDEFIYLITLNTFGAMSKTELIKRNKQDKPSGIQIINRLINFGWINQVDSDTDKRSKILEISQAGKAYLEYKMEDIRRATKVVSANLTENEKLELVRLLSKMDKFHHKIYSKNLSADKLLDQAFQDYNESIS